MKNTSQIIQSKVTFCVNNAPQMSDEMSINKSVSSDLAGTHSVSFDNFATKSTD